MKPLLGLQTLAILLSLIFSTSLSLDIKPTISYAVRQYAILSERLSYDDPDSGFISTGNPLNPFWDKNDVTRWTVGFYGGSLWTLYKLTEDPYWRNLAEEFQERVKGRQYDTETHDVGFVIMSTFGLCLDYTENEVDTVSVIGQAAASLATRFHELSRVIRSWNNDEGHGGVPGEVKVIADNMMNLELLFRASELTGNGTFREMAVSHANRTIEEHFRPDGSTFHVVAYNESTGLVERKYNWQGLRDESTWARGLSWVIHGYTTSYQMTGGDYPKFLEYAEIAGSYFISHLPSDYIPYWDFDADWETSYQPRDTSAGSIAAHAFLKLFSVTGNQTYFTVGERILENLAASYSAEGKEEYKIPSILVNGTVFYHEGNMNTAIVYADFYFLQALSLYKDLQEGRKEREITSVEGERFRQNF